MRDNTQAKLDDILDTLAEKSADSDSRLGYVDAYVFAQEAKQALTSLIKELVAEAKPYRETIIDKWNKDRADEVKATNAAMNAWADIYEQNLLKALEDK